MSIGGALAGARRQAGLTVAEVSGRTRIRQALIESIEHDDFTGCGGDFYARGHIRSIARVVGADPAPLIAEYDAAHRETSPSAASSLDELLGYGRAERRRWLLRPVLLSLVLVAALGVAGVSVLAGARNGARGAPAAGSSPPTAARRPSGPPARPSPRPSPRPSGSAPPGAVTLTPAGATAFGPGGPGQGDNPGLAPLAIDRNPGTAWHTDWYTTPSFGNLYAGTGLLLDMGRPVTVTSARVSLGAAGAAVELRVGPAPALADLRIAARVDGAGPVALLRLRHPARGRYVLLWFTRLPRDAAGTFQASVYDVRVRGS